MASSKPATGGHFKMPTECHNCYRKGRKVMMEEKDVVVFMQCKQCHLLSYCDKDCQEEHWMKVHKYHCKHLSGKKNLVGAVHR